MLAHEAYRSIRFYDAVSAATAVSALGDLQQPPASVDALVRALVMMIGYFRGAELVPLWEGLSKLHISHRMLTAHILKRYLRYMRATLRSDPPPLGSPARQLDTALTALLSMVATTQRFHTQRTTRAFLLCADECLGPSLSQIILLSFRQCAGFAVNEDPPPGTPPPVVGCGAGVSEEALVPRVLFLFEVYRSACLVDGAPTSALPHLLVPLLLLVAPHANAKQAQHVLSVLLPRGHRMEAPGEGGNLRARDVVVAALLRRLNDLGEPMNSVPACCHLTDHGQWGATRDDALGCAQTRGMAPPRFLRLVQEDYFLQMLTSHGEEAGEHEDPWLVLDGCLRDAVHCATHGDAEGGHPVDLPSPDHFHALLPPSLRGRSKLWDQLVLVPRTGQGRRREKNALSDSAVGYTQILLSLLLFLRQLKCAAAAVAVDERYRSGVANILRHSVALFQLTSRRPPVLLKGGRAAQQSNRSDTPLLHDDELQLLWVALSMLQHQDDGGVSLREWCCGVLNSHTVDEDHQQRQELAAGVVETFFAEVAQHVRVTLPRWEELLRVEGLWFASTRQHHGCRTRWPALRSPTGPGRVGAKRMAMEMAHQQREMTVLNWQILAQVLLLHDAPTTSSSETVVVSVSTAASHLVSSLSAWCVESLPDYPCDVSWVDCITQAFLSAWHAARGEAVRSVLASARFLPSLLSHCEKRIDAGGAAWTHWRRADGAGEKRLKERMVRLSPSLPTTAAAAAATTAELGIQLLECVLSATDVPLCIRHCNDRAARRLLQCLTKWHPLVRQSATSVRDWNALQALCWVLDADRRYSDERDGSAAPCRGLDGSTLPLANDMNQPWRNGTPQGQDGGGPFSRNPSTQSLPLWECGSNSNESVTEILMYGARRAAHWGRSSFENTLKEAHVLPSALGRCWGRTEDAHVPLPPPSYPLSLGETREETSAVLDNMLKRLFLGSTNNDAAPLGSPDSLRPSSPTSKRTLASPHQVETLSRRPKGDVEDYLAGTRLEVSLDAAVELLRLEELLHRASSAASSEEERGGIRAPHSCPQRDAVYTSPANAVRAPFPSQRPDTDHHPLHHPSFPLLQARALCYLGIVFFISLSQPVTHAERGRAGSRDWCDKRGEFVRRTVRFLDGVERYARADTAASASVGAGQDLAEYELPELQLTTVAILKCALPTLLLSVLRAGQDETPDHGAFTTLTRWLTALFPLPRALQPLYDELSLVYTEALSLTETPIASPPTCREIVPWMCFEGGHANPLRHCSLRGKSSERFHLLLLGFLEAERIFPDQGGEEDGWDVSEVDLRFRHAAVLHRTIALLLQSLEDLERRGRGDGAAAAAAGGGQASLSVLNLRGVVVQRVITSLVTHSLLHHILQTYGLPLMASPSPPTAMPLATVSRSPALPSCEMRREQGDAHAFPQHSLDLLISKARACLSLEQASLVSATCLRLCREVR